MLENIRLSFQGIWSHKMRSFLTMLGIIIGIAAIGGGGAAWYYRRKKKKEAEAE